MKTIQFQVTVALDDVSKETLTGIVVDAVKRSVAFNTKFRQSGEALWGHSAVETLSDRMVVERLSGPDSTQPLALRPREAAKALQISPRLLWQLSKDGKVPCIRVGSGKRQTLLYSVAALKDWLEDRSMKGVH